MKIRITIGSAILIAFGIVTQAQGPALVIKDGQCTTGWVGCPADLGVLLPDGSYTCLLQDIAIIGFTGDEIIELIPNGSHGNGMRACRNHLEFGQLNPVGADGETDWVALKFAEARILFPSAFQGNGAAVINERTLPGVGSCVVNDVVTLNYQSVVTRSGNVNLRCFLPNPPQGN